MRQFKKGDIVRQFLTEQLGVVVKVKPNSVQVVWTTKGLSMWVGNKTWESPQSLEVLDEANSKMG